MMKVGHSARSGQLKPAREAILDFADRQHRDADRREIERHHVIALDMLAEEQQPDDAERGDRGRGDDALHTAAEQDAAQEIEFAPLAIFRDEAHDRRLDAEAGEAADDDGADPDHDIDAIVEIAHPAGEQNLREIGDEGRDDAHQEGRDGDPLRDRPLVLAGGDRIHAGRQPRKRRLQPGRSPAIDDAGKGKAQRVAAPRRGRPPIEGKPSLKSL